MYRQAIPDDGCGMSILAKSVDSLGTASIEVAQHIVSDEWQATCGILFLIPLVARRGQSLGIASRPS